MKISNRYAEHMQNFSVSLMIPSHAYNQVDPTRERIMEEGAFVDASTKTWCNLGLSVTPKAHTFEDHEIEYMQALHGLGDKTKDFIELSHLDAARQDRRKQVLRKYNQKHESQHKVEHQSSYPKVQKAKGKTRAKSTLH